MHLMQFIVKKRQKKKKKNKKGIQNIHRHKLKQLDLECSKNFSSIFKQSIQAALPISFKLSVTIGSEVVPFLTLT